MEAGRIIDIGTHDEMLARCGLYRRLHQIPVRRPAAERSTCEAALPAQLNLPQSPIPW